MFVELKGGPLDGAVMEAPEIVDRLTFCIGDGGGYVFHDYAHEDCPFEVDQFAPDYGIWLDYQGARQDKR
jgi:hypothetical protein